MTETTLISIVVPTFNRREILPRAIRSVLAQTRDAWELIIVDDESDDDTESAVQPFLTDRRITFERKPWGGASAARNHGAAIANGRYLTFLDSDDVADPRWLASLLNGFEEHGADIVTTLCEIKTPDGVTRRVEWENYHPMFTGAYGNFTHGGTWALRRELFSAIGGFVDHLPAAEHTELGYRLLAEAEKHQLVVHWIDEPLITYFAERHDGLRKNDIAVLEAAEYLIEHHGERMARDPARLADSHAIIAFRAARLNRRATARSHATVALRLTPANPRAWVRALVVWVWVFRPTRWQAQEVMK